MTWMLSASGLGRHLWTKTSSNLTLTLACLPFMVLLLALPAASSGQLMEGIFPQNYMSYRYGLDHRSKRLADSLVDDCGMCLAVYDLDACLRCWQAPPSPQLGEDDMRDLLDQALEDEGLGGMQAEKRSRGGGMVRSQRQVGCGCCYLSRFSNVHCCRACSIGYKRAAGKRAYDAEAAAELAEYI